MSKVPRAATYIRRSSAHDLDKSQSPAVQEDATTRYIEDRGWQFDPDRDVYRDLGKSAWRSSSRRPAFERLLEACANGRYDRLVVYMLDRLSRDWAQWGRILGELPADFEIHSAQEGVSSENTFTLQMFAAMAQEASDKIATRVRASKARRAAQGAWLGSIRPFGFVPGEIDGRRALLVNHASDEPEALCEVIDMVVEGTSVTQAARWLSNNGHLSTMQRTWWSHEALMRLLRSPVLFGGVATKSNEIVLDDAGQPRIVGEPLIPLDRWLQLRARLDAQRKTRAAARSSLLQGIVRCADCGHTMGASGGKEGHTAIYRCSSRRVRGLDCEGCNVSRLRLDATVSLLALLLLIRPLKRVQTDHQVERIAQLHVALESLMADLYPAGPQPSPEVKAAMRRQLTVLQDELEAATKVTDIRGGPGRLPKEVRDALGRDFAAAGITGLNLDALESFAAFRGLPSESQRALIASVIDSAWITRRTRQEALAVPIEQRGHIEGRITISLASDPDTRIPYVDALEQATIDAARQLASG